MAKNFRQFSKKIVLTELFEKYGKKHLLCERNMIAQGDEKIIVHISNFRPLKRIIDVLKIFSRISKK